MACSHPFKAFKTGNKTDTGKDELIICPTTAGDVLSVASAERKGYRISSNAPLIRHGDKTFINQPLTIPCGNCVNCRITKAKQWKIRLCLEALDYSKDDVHFVTLTYRDDALPHVYGQPCLRKEDLQGFLNNLRNPKRGVHRFFRYFACGEYGDNTLRPHYHLILFGKLDDCVPFAFNRSHSASISKAWPFGLHEVSPAVPGTIAYVAGYVEKKANDPLYDDYPVKPFITMSTKPMIGHSYIAKLKNGIPSRKVYGDFGNFHYASVPPAFLKKLEDSPWFEDYKAASRKIGDSMLRLNLLAAHTKNQDLLGDLIEATAYQKLEKVRFTKL